MVRRSKRDEQGSIVMAVLVIFVASALTMTTATLVESGLRSSRRAGDSANALQLADAAVNDAIKRVTEWTSGPTTIPVAGNLGAAGSYAATATRESASTWRIDAVGTDSTGVKRRVRATAVAESIFANAVFTRSTMIFHAGSSVDSFLNGLNAANTCTGKGYVGTNSPATADLDDSGGGGGVVNCAQGVASLPDTAFDGCIGYANDEPVPDFPAVPTGSIPDQCGAVLKKTPAFQPDPPTTTGVVVSTSPLVCTSATPLAPGRYQYSSITLQDGCRLSLSANFTNPVELFTEGPIRIGTSANARINRPGPGCTGTVATGTDYFPSPSPLYYYCPRWSGALRIYGLGGGPTAQVEFQNHAEFWGVISAPNYVLGGGSGNPQAKVWGALVGSSLATNAQFAVHYDESLKDLSTGRFTLASWREEPLV